jgi:hypothetical protein
MPIAAIDPGEAQMFAAAAETGLFLVSGDKLQAIEPSIRQGITPLLEIVERIDKELDGHLNTAFKDLGDSVRPYARCFLDAREIAPDGPAGAAEVFDRASSAGIVSTPVTGITRSADVAAALSHRAQGVALRLTRDEFEAGNITGSLEAFMSQHGLAPEETDLIVDLGPVDDLVVDGVSALTDAFLAEVPDHTRWRTFTVSGCAFPPSMGSVGQHSHDLVERAEWIAWRDNLHSRRQGLPRLPTFSDCAIQHPMGVEGFDPRTMQVSAAVRYAKGDAWLLIKGESTRRKPPSEQFPILATQLVYGHLRSHFAGGPHCDGCAGMKAAADGAPRLGSAEAWRCLGTIHHITTAVRTLESLPWP